ncbi:MAG: hypothetical protein ACLFPP_07845 [Spirochaetaceae bacterium]
MNERLLRLLSLLLVLTSLALFVARRWSAVSDPPRGARAPSLKAPSETARVAGSLPSVPEATDMERLFPSPTPEPERTEAADSGMGVDEPMRDAKTFRREGREVGYLRLAGGKAMIFVRRR